MLLDNQKENSRVISVLNMVKKKSSIMKNKGLLEGYQVDQKVAPVSDQGRLTIN